MASERISKYSFEWVKEEEEAFDVEKTFNMKVGGLNVKCCATIAERAFSYELTWPNCHRKPLLYTSHVQMFHKEALLWSDKKMTANGGHVWSSDNFPKGELIEEVKLDFEIVAKFDFEFVTEERSSMSMLEEKILTDVVVVCGEKRFECHKFMLAKQSEYFERMLTGSFKEAKEGIIRIEVFPPNVVKTVIDFIYGGNVAKDSISWELYEAAEMYALPRLKVRCLRGLRKNLSANTIWQMLEESLKRDLEDIYKYAVEFVKTNKELSKTDMWKKLTSGTDLANDILLDLM